MEQSGNIPIFNIPGTLFGNIPRNFKGNFFRIFWEYIMEMFHEYSTNIYLPGGLYCTACRLVLLSHFNIAKAFNDYTLNSPVFLF